MNQKYLLDACVLIAYLFDETESDYIESLLRKSINGELEVCISAINYGEVCIFIHKNTAKPKSLKLLSSIKNNFNIQLLDVSLDIIEQAAVVKSVGGLSYPDAIALVTAQKHNLTILTKDREFEKFSKTHKIEFL